MRRSFGLGLGLLLFAGLFAGGRAQAQQRPPISNQPPTITSTLDTQLTIVEFEFTGAAKAMPEDKYSFAPTNGNFKGVRTFAQEVKHVATANDRFFDSILGRTPPAAPDEGVGSNGPDSIQTKDQILQYLKESFALGHKAIATINAENARHSDGETRRTIPEDPRRPCHVLLRTRHGSLRPDGRIFAR